MHLAVWDIPPAVFLASGFVEADGVQVEYRPPSACRALLDEGQVDVALLPTTTVLTNVEAYDILPAVALSSWDYPYARLVLRKGFKGVDTLALDPRYTQEAFVATVVLKEHYRATPELVGVQGSPEELLASDAAAVLLAGPEAASLPRSALSPDDVIMDLGQEWYELVNYPMVWGLFATLKEQASPAQVRTLIRAAKRAEGRRQLWLQANETTPELAGFFQDSLRVRLDDLAVASLTELRHYLFYFGATPDIPDFPLVSFREEDVEGDKEAAT
jgi:predicted solute-binding protein